MRKTHLTSLVLIAAVAITGCGRSAKRENAQLKEENATLNSQLSDCNESNQAMQSKYSQTVAAASARVKDLTSQVEASKKSASAAQARYPEAARAFNSLKSKSDQDARSLAEANDQLNAMKAEMEKSAADTAALREQANAQIAELSRQIATLQAKQAEAASKPVSVARPAAGGRSTANVNEK